MLPIRPGILSPGCAGLLTFCAGSRVRWVVVPRKNENDPPIVTPTDITDVIGSVVCDTYPAKETI